METKDILKHLEKLCRVDIDAVGSYEQAIQNVDDHTIRQKLEEFKGDHERHYHELSDHMKKHGGEPPEYKPDFKGFMLQGFTAIRAATGTEGALKAMESNENTTNKHYSEAIEHDWPDDIMQVIQKNWQDEQRHLDYIERTLQARPWDKQPRA